MALRPGVDADGGGNIAQKAVSPHEFDQGWLGLFLKATNHHASYDDDLAKALSKASDTSPRTIIDCAVALVRGLGMEAEVVEALERC
ncbi:MAG: hypothetical protein JRN50_02330 [Nitrososphaerota archaeon]|nr:hypothetical protein [Nitrososphaerota archaeon]